MPSKPVTAFQIVIGASHKAELNRHDHEQLELATGEIARKLIDGDANAKRVDQLTEELRVAAEQRDYYELVTGTLLMQISKLGETAKIGLVEIPDSIDSMEAPGDEDIDAPGSNGAAEPSPPGEPTEAPEAPE